MISGFAILDFGPFPGSAQTAVRVRGLPTIAASSSIEAWLRPQLPTGGHSVDDHIVEQIKVLAGGIVPGEGFTIYGECLTGFVTGQFVVQWAVVLNTQPFARTFSMAQMPSRGIAGAATIDQEQFWSPLLIPGVTAWFRADTVVSAAGAVSQWTDKTGNNRHLFQTTAAMKPTLIAGDATLNGQPSLFFDGTDDQLSSTGGLMTHYIATTGYGTVFAVFVAEAVNTNAAAYDNDHVWCDNGGNIGLILAVTPQPVMGAYGWDAGGAQGRVGPLALMEAQSAVWQRTATAVTFKANSGSATGDTNILLPAAVSGALHVGRNFTAAQLFNGRIAELVFSNVDASSAYPEWLTYVKERYGIESEEWTPSQLPGLTCWLRADDCWTNGNVINQMNDRTGNQRHWSAPGGPQQPAYLATAFNGKPCIGFDGTAQYLSRASGGSLTPDIVTTTDGTIAVIYAVDAIDTNFGNIYENDALVTGGNGPISLTLKNNAGACTVIASNYNQTTGYQAVGTPISLATPYLTAWTHSGGTTLGISHQGNYLVSTTPSLSTSLDALTARIGTNYNATQKFDGKIAEVIFCNQAISSTDYAELWAYAQRRYGPNLWTPLLLAGLTAWFRADDVAASTTVAGAIRQWNDKSGNGRHLTQAASVNQPLYVAADAGLNGMPAIDFDGVDDYLGGSALSEYVTASTCTIFAVILADVVDTSNTDGNAWSGDAVVTDATGNLGIHLSSAGPGRAQAFNYSGSNAGVGTDYTIGTAASVILRHNATTLAVKVNSGAEATGGTASTSSLVQPLRVARSAGVQYFDGRIAEIVICNTDESANYAAWLAYVNARYGI